MLEFILRICWFYRVDSCSCGLYNFLHIKQNTYSPCLAQTKHNPPALKERLAALWYAVFPLLLLQYGWVLSVSPPCLSQLRPSSLSQRFLHTFPHWLTLPLPCSLSLTFFPLCSSLQRGEKHTCQIQVGHHTVSHPHQLLSTRCFDANKFFQHRRVVPYSSWIVRSLSEMVNATAVQCQCPCDRAIEVPCWTCSDPFHRRVNYWKRLLVLWSAN